MSLGPSHRLTVTVGQQLIKLTWSESPEVCDDSSPMNSGSLSQAAKLWCSESDCLTLYITVWTIPLSHSNLVVSFACRLSTFSHIDVRLVWMIQIWSRCSSDRQKYVHVYMCKYLWDDMQRRAHIFRTFMKTVLCQKRFLLAKITFENRYIEKNPIYTNYTT